MFCFATSTPSKSMAGLLVLLLCSFVSPSDARIEVMESGTEYQSRPDKYVGLQMKVGVEYGARLQRIHEDLHLCGTGHWNVTAPGDGRPVALLVKKGLCSYAQKAEFATRNIHPRGIVKILIIDGEIRIRDDEYKDDDDYDESTLQDEWKGDGDSDAPISSYEFPSYYNDGNYSEVTLQKRKEDDISVALLHVSYRTGVELLDVILNEDPDVREKGGALLTVDGAAPPMTRTIVLIWTAVCVVVSLLACCCLAGAVQELLETHEPEPEPPRRPRRQRLTIDQIRKIPVGIFDGSQLVYDDEEEAMRDLESGEDSCRPESSVFIQPAQHSLDACTICLDDYEIGDKLRCLPCGHAFHANCIAKWLYERSATCPLCNKDLYEEEEEDDEDDEDEDENENDVEQQQGAPATPSDTETTENTTTTTESSGEPWWRTIFRSSRRQDRQVSEELTEPLLQQQQQQQQHQEEEEVETERSEATSVQETPISEESNIDSSSGNEELADGASSD